MRRERQVGTPCRGLIGTGRCGQDRAIVAKHRPDGHRPNGQVDRCGSAKRSARMSSARLGRTNLPRAHEGSEAAPGPSSSVTPAGGPDHDYRFATLLRAHERAADAAWSAIAASLRSAPDREHRAACACRPADAGPHIRSRRRPVRSAMAARSCRRRRQRRPPRRRQVCSAGGGRIRPSPQARERARRARSSCPRPRWRRRGPGACA